MPQAGAPQTFTMAAIARLVAAVRVPAEAMVPATVGIVAVGLLGAPAIAGLSGAEMGFAIVVALAGAVLNLPGPCGPAATSRCAALPAARSGKAISA